MAAVSVLLVSHQFMDTNERREALLHATTSSIVHNVNNATIRDLAAVVAVVDPQFARNEHIFAWNTSTASIRKHCRESGTNLGFVPIDIGAIDVTVSHVQGRLDGGTHDTWIGLPCPQTNRWHSRAALYGVKNLLVDTAEGINI